MSGNEYHIGYLKWRKTIKLVKWNILPKIKLFGKINHFEDFYMHDIIEAYTKGRYYHTLRHINYMLTHVKDFELTKKEQAKLELAIWFHDFVYNSKKGDNELISAIYFIKYAKTIGLKRKEIKEIKELIIDTSHRNIPITKLGKIICDLDLREFVNDRQELNSIEVRNEYSQLSNKKFYKGRIEFLRSLLNKKHIYHTKLYQGGMEDLAIDNLMKELKILTNIYE